MSNIKITFFSTAPLGVFILCLLGMCPFGLSQSPPQEEETSATIMLLNEALKDAVMNRTELRGVLEEQSDELASAKRLLRENYYNHLTTALNHASQAVMNALQGKLQSFAQLPIDLVYGWYQLGLSSPRERKSLFLLRQFQRKYPQSPERPDIESLAARLDEKRKKSLSDQEYRYGRFFLKNSKLPRALFHLENAASLNPSSHKLGKYLFIARQELAKEERHRQASLSVLDGEDFFLSEEEKKSYRKLISIIAKGDGNSLLYEAREFQSRFPDSNYADDAAYSEILGFDMSRNGKYHIQYLKRLIRRYPDANASRFARMTLRDSSFYPLFNVEQAKKEYHADLERYILFGNRSLDEQVYIASSSAVHYFNFSENIGIIFLLDALLRGAKCLVTNPISQDGILEAVCYFERTNPHDPDITAIRKMLASMYAGRDRYPRALSYAQKAGTFSADELRKLSHSHAKYLYRLILQNPDPQQKIRYLTQLVSLFPDAPVTKKARKELDKLVAESLKSGNSSQGSKEEKPKERPFPLELSGAWGPSGWEVYPAFLPLEEDEEGLNLFR